VGGPLLLRIPNWLGDLVLALPVVASAAARPDGVLLVGPEPYAPILTRRFPRAEYVPWTRSRRLGPLARLRAARPRAALLLTDSFSSALLAYLARIPERIGHDAEHRGVLLTRRVRRRSPARTARRAEEYAALASAAGIAVQDPVPRLTAVPEEVEAARRTLRPRLGEGTPYAVLAPGASYGPAKRWAPERFAKVAGALAGQHGLALVLVGSREDAAPAAETEAAVRGRAVNLAGETDLTTLVGLLAGAALVVSNDSGVMHLGAALARPTVGVFGSTSPVWTASDAPWVRNLYAAYPCSPCFRRTCPIGYGCLRSIEPEHAVRAAEELLAAR